jgi:predicted restriction endonuclease
VKTFRFVRDTRLSRAVKEVHQNKCQICGTSVLMADGSGYSEGHHIRPLGKNHGGPDDASNIICLCPNHHVALDACAMKINLEELRVHARHKIDPEQVEYHNELVERLAAALV